RVVTEAGGRRWAVARNGAFCLLAFLVLAASCGKKAPPRPPLNLVPDAAAPFAGRRIGNSVYLQMTVPTKNGNGPGPISLGRIDIYGATVGVDVPVPTNPELMKPAFLIGHIDVRPPVDPDAPLPDVPVNDTRPRPGDVVSFVEPLTAAQSVAQILQKPPSKKAAQQARAKRGGRGTGGSAAAGTVGAAPAAAAKPSGVPVLTRVYMVVGLTPKGRPGAASARVTIPLVAPPPALARAPVATASQTSVSVTWTPPPSSSDESLGLTYNVYAAPTGGSAQAAKGQTAPEPLNPKPIEELTFEHPGAEPGKEQCFTVRTVATVVDIPIESDASPAGCVTPRDTFPPAAPKNLAVVGGTGGRMNLIWDANTETDLAGYIVLRAEAPDGTLQPLTPQPIKEPRYTDETAKSGTTYMYAVIAVDASGNRSERSNTVTETAR
ncbi:MAG TPA: fibronectin type III domain-containing protein, partial [Vicinamibacterales bacterium]